MTAYFLVINKSKINNYLIIFLNSLMGIPPVVVGLIVYFIFSKGGLLGVFSILYTPTAMVIAQIILVYPIISSLLYEVFYDFWNRYRDTLRLFNMPGLAILFTFIKNSFFMILIIVLTGFGRAISEVGAVMIVGGNIDHYTRVMTTAIALETSVGNLQKATSLGLILVLISMITYSIIYKFNKRKNI